MRYLIKRPCGAFPAGVARRAFLGQLARQRHVQRFREAAGIIAEPCRVVGTGEHAALKPDDIKGDGALALAKARDEGLMLGAGLSDRRDLGPVDHILGRDDRATVRP